MVEKTSPFSPYVAAVGVVLMIGAVAVQQLHAGPEWLPLAIGAAGFLLLLVLPITRAQELRAALGSRQARFGGNTLVLLVSVLGILVVANVLGSLRFVRLDTTKNQRFSISNQTKTILDDLRDRGQQVKITAVMPVGDPRRADLEQLMDRYAGYGNTVSFVALDPQLDQMKARALAESIERSLSGSEVIVQAGDKTDVVYESDEKAITASIIKVTRDKQKVIAFTIGHGEYSTTGGTGQRGFSALSQGLTQDGYKVETVQVATSDTLQADVIVIAGAQEPFNPQELERLAAYHKAGGNLLILADPQDKADFAPLLEPYGLALRNDLVIDVQSPINPGVPVIRPDGVQYHEITRDLDTPSYLMTILPGARSIAVPATPVSGTTTTVLFKTTDESWGETDLAGLQAEDAQPTQDEADAAGPLDVAVAAESSGTGGPGRLVVIGSAGIVADATLQQVAAPGNPVVTLNAVNWLTQDNALMGIRPTEPDDRPLTPPGNKLLVFLTTVLFIPAAVAALGFYIWWQRR